MAHPPGKKSDAHGDRSRSRSPSVSATTRRTDAARRSSATADATKGESGSASHKPGTETASPKDERGRGRSPARTKRDGASERAGSSLPFRPGLKTDGATAATGVGDSNAAPEKNIGRKRSIFELVTEGVELSRKGSTHSLLSGRKPSLADSLGSLDPSPYIRRDSAQSADNVAKATTKEASGESPKGHTKAATKAPGDGPPASQPSSNIKSATGNTLRPPATPGSTKQSGLLLPRTPTPRRGANLRVGTDGRSRPTPTTGRTGHSDGIPRTPSRRFGTPGQPPTPSPNAAARPSPLPAQNTDREFKYSEKVGDLRVLLDPVTQETIDAGLAPSEVKMDPAPKESMEFKVTAHCAYTGLRICEHILSLPIFAEGGFHLVEDKKKKRQKIMYDRELTELRNSAMEFLEKTRADFPTIIITRGLHTTSRAETDRTDWPTAVRERKMRENPNLKDFEVKLEHYEPKDAAVIYINYTTFDTLNRQCEARDEAKEKKDKAAEKNACENISNTLFYLAVTLAHEIYHCWFGFLVGYADLYTPMFTDFPLPDYDPAKPEDYEDAEGESGSWFESKLMEGLIFMLENTTDILKLDQSGTPYLADEAGRCFKVSREFVDNVNNDKLSLAHTSGGLLGKVKENEFEITWADDLRKAKVRDLPEMREDRAKEIKAKNQRRKSSSVNFLNEPPKEQTLLTVDDLRELNEKKNTKTFHWKGPLDPASIKARPKPVQASKKAGGKPEWKNPNY